MGNRGEVCLGVGVGGLGGCAGGGWGVEDKPGSVCVKVRKTPFADSLGWDTNLYKYEITIQRKVYEDFNKLRGLLAIHWFSSTSSFSCFLLS